MKCGTWDCDSEAVVIVKVKTPMMFAAGQHPACQECYNRGPSENIVSVRRVQKAYGDPRCV